MPFWNDHCQYLTNYCWKPSLQPKEHIKLCSHSWFSGEELLFDCSFPLLTINDKVTPKHTFCRKIRIIPNNEQRHQLVKWWHAYRYTYNKTIEGIIKETESQFEQLKHSYDNVDEVGYRSEVCPKISLKIKEFKKKDNPLQVKLFVKYPKVSDWKVFRNFFVTKKDNAFFEDKQHKWLLGVYKTIRASACKDACANYKTVRTLCDNFGKSGTIATMDFKSKRSESWSIGMEACNVKVVSKKFKKKGKTIKRDYVQVCDIKTPIRLKERFNKDFGDPKLHKDKFGDFWLILPYTKEASQQERTLKPLCALDSGIKTFITSYDGNGKIRRYGTDQQPIIDILKKQGKRKNEDKAILLQKKLKNRIDDLHWKVIKDLTDHSNLIVLGNLKVKQIMESSTITKTAKRKLTALSLYKFKQRLIYKGLSKGQEIVVYNEYGTTKTCPCCGHWNSKIGLGDRTFSCSKCHYKADRDDKAALCILLKYEAKM
jgi:IS605 OrfB family transposase